MLAKAKSDIGRVREINEDSFICAPPLLVVADGMGGHVAGEVASQLAAATLQKCVLSQTDQPAAAALNKAIEQANTLIYRMAKEKNELSGMGTTVTAAYVDEAVLYWGHVGDSRLYLVRDGELQQITEDHSLVGELVRSGSISAEEALTHPHRNILTRAVGTSDQVRVDSGAIDLREGDVVLLCTDGLTNMVPDEEIRDILLDGANAVEALIDRANAAGGLDNITVIAGVYGGGQ
ncbi:MAG TPA: Stp1/IreP family PP2C-type Ser/Thr phosphatase [Selenomonadales bacterium]|nr:Stp1/IreP family PP2C-type Ser/Thr phosphatase [Selenomonadales bacterium]